MAGKPKVREDMARLTEKRDEVMEALAQGLSQHKVRELFAVSRTAWDRWMGSEEGGAAYARARTAAAHTLAEEVLDIGETVEADKDEIAKAKLRIDNRKWLAEVWAPDLYAKQQAPAVQLNVQQLHLEAVRAASREPIEGEVVSTYDPDLAGPQSGSEGLEQDDWLG